MKRVILMVSMALLVFGTAPAVIFGQTESHAADGSPPDDMRNVAQEATDHYNKQEYDQAAACFQRIIDKDPDSLYAWSNLGAVRYHQNNYKDTISAMRRSLELAPRDAFSWAYLGISYYQLKQYDEATDALKKAVDFNPDDAKSRNYLGCCYCQKGWQDQAEKQFQKAIELDPTLGDTCFNLALLYATTKPPEVEQAQKYYRQALKLGVAADPRLEKLMPPKASPD